MRSYDTSKIEDGLVLDQVVRDKRTGKTKGYGFISFSNPTDRVGALKEMNGKYVGNRPIKLRRSTYLFRKDRQGSSGKTEEQGLQEDKTIKEKCVAQMRGENVLALGGGH